MKRIADLLQKMPLFEGIGSEELQEIARMARFHRVDRGEKVRVDEGRGGLFIVLSGFANVLRVQGEEKTFLFSLGPGDSFGEPPLPRAGPGPSREFAAHTAFDLLEIGWEPFFSRLSKRPVASAAVMARVLAAASEKFVRLSREYCHLVRQASVSEQAIHEIFALPPEGRIRTEERAR